MIGYNRNKGLLNIYQRQLLGLYDQCNVLDIKFHTLMHQVYGPLLILQIPYFSSVLGGWFKGEYFNVGLVEGRHLV